MLEMPYAKIDVAFRKRTAQAKLQTNATSKDLFFRSLNFAAIREVSVSSPKSWKNSEQTILRITHQHIMSCHWICFTHSYVQRTSGSKWKTLSSWSKWYDETPSLQTHHLSFQSYNIAGIFKYLKLECTKQSDCLGANSWQQLDPDQKQSTSLHHSTRSEMPLSDRIPESPIYIKPIFFESGPWPTLSTIPVMIWITLIHSFTKYLFCEIRKFSGSCATIAR